jgi:hypothetical protein
MGASRHDDHLLQVEMFFGLGGSCACPNSLMGEEQCAKTGSFERYMRGAARHSEMTCLPVLKLKDLPLVTGQVESVDASATRIEASQRHC